MAEIDVKRGVLCEKFGIIPSNSGKKTIVYVAVDSTGSMSATLEAVKAGVLMLIGLLLLCDIEVVIVFYGDYSLTIREIENVVTIIQSDFDIYVKFYKINQNGGGGDEPEALITALNMIALMMEIKKGYEKQVVIVVTDANYHTGLLYVDEEKFEIEALKKYGLPDNFTSVCESIKKYGASINVITSYDRPVVYKDCNTNAILIETKLTKETVSIAFCVIFNYWLSGGKTVPGIVFPDDFNISYPKNKQMTPTEIILDVVKPDQMSKFYKDFQSAVSECSEILKFAGPVLARVYYKCVRDFNKTDEHGKFLKTLTNVPKNVIEWFKSQESQKMFNLRELNTKISFKSLIEARNGRPVIPLSEFALIKGGDSHLPTEEFLQIIAFVNKTMGPSNISNLIRILQGLIIVSTEAPDFNPDEHLILSAIQEDPKLICSFLCKPFGVETIPEIMSLSPITVAAILQFCKNAPQLLEIFSKYVKQPTFMSWTNGNAKIPKWITNPATIEFIRNALTSYETNANKEVLSWISKVLRFYNMSSQTCECSYTLVSKNDTSVYEMTKSVESVYMSSCLICGIRLPINLFVKISTLELQIIRDRMTNYICEFKPFETDNPMFIRFGTIEKWNAYMDNLETFCEKNGTILVSTYGLNICRSDNETGIPYMTPEGVIDPYTYTKMTNDKHLRPIPDTYEGMESMYNNFIGHDGEKLISELNMIPTTDIKENGTKMVCCTKKKKKVSSTTCGCVYMAADTSSGALSTQATCAGCRLTGITLYPAKCQTCNTAIAMGTQVPDFDSKDCVFCKIPPVVRTIPKVSLQTLVSNNLEVFSEYFGIPISILKKLTSQKPFGVLTTEKEEFLIPELLNSEIWKRTRYNFEGLSLKYEGNSLTPKSIKTIVELINNNFLSDCFICTSTVKVNTMIKCPGCKFSWCVNCSDEMCGDKAWINQEQSAQNYGCSQCSKTFTKGFAIKRKYGCLHSALKSDLVEQLDDHHNKMKTCGMPNHDPTHCRSFIERAGACGLPEDADDGRAKTIECNHCTETRVKLAQENAKRETFDGTAMPTGHYILPSGIIYRPCPACSFDGIRIKGCWSQHCHCDTHFCWCCGMTGDIYGHLNTKFGKAFVTGDPKNPDLYLPPEMEASLTPEQKHAVELARQRGGNETPAERADRLALEAAERADRLALEDDDHDDEYDYEY